MCCWCHFFPLHSIKLIYRSPHWILIKSKQKMIWILNFERKRNSRMVTFLFRQNSFQSYWIIHSLVQEFLSRTNDLMYSKMFVFCRIKCQEKENHILHLTTAAVDILSSLLSVVTFEFEFYHSSEGDNDWCFHLSSCNNYRAFMQIVMLINMNDSFD